MAPTAGFQRKGLLDATVATPATDSLERAALVLRVQGSSESLGCLCASFQSSVMSGTLLLCI